MEVQRGLVHVAGVVGTAPCLGQPCSGVHPVPKFMSAIRKDLGPLGAQ